jgi:hypothetical protein
MTSPHRRSPKRTALSRFLRPLFPRRAAPRRWPPPAVEALEDLLPPNGLAGAISDARGG